MDEAMFSVLIAWDVLVPMRDGTHLATDIYWPARNGKRVDSAFPVVIERGPHGKSSFARRYPAGEFWAQHGYIALVQDCRGCFASEGVWTGEEQEIPDGADLVAWTAEQAWCDGNIGLHGTSYQGLTAVAAALTPHPALKAVWAHQPLDIGNLRSTVNSGALELWHLTWLAGVAALNQTKAIPPEASDRLNRLDIEQWLEQLPFDRAATLFEGVPGYDEWLRRTVSSPPYDHLNGLGGARTDIDAAVCISASWLDTEVRSNLDRVVFLDSLHPNRISFLVGPWRHGHLSPTTSSAYDVSFGDSAGLEDWLERLEAFFAAHLKSAGDGTATKRIFVMGGGSGRLKNELLDHGGTWQDINNWPPPPARIDSFYLTADAKLSTSPAMEGGGPASVSFVYDPLDPTPTIGAASRPFSVMTRLPPEIPATVVPFMLRIGPVKGLPDAPDTAPVAFTRGSRDHRSDVIAFESDPVATQLEVIGDVSAELYIQTTAPGGDFVVTFIDVYPPSDELPQGYRVPLGEGIVRMQWREENGSLPSPLKPDKIYRVFVEVCPTAAVLAAGHRVRVEIAAASFPRFDPNPAGVEAAAVVAQQGAITNLVHCSALYPSRLQLPVAR